MIIQNGCIHYGDGSVSVADIRVTDGRIAEIRKDMEIKGEETVDAHGAEVLPGFIQTLSNWGINGSWTEIRPSSQDNDEISNPITPELDVRYAFNGRAATTQQLGAFGVTVIGVGPTDNNLFGGQMAVFEVDGVNPLKMCIRSGIGMKASVTEDPKKAYGKRETAPMTKMWLFENLEQQMRKASLYKEDSAAGPDAKMAALRKVLDHKMPLFISCDDAQAIRHVLEILKPYDLSIVICNGYGLHAEDSWMLEGKTSLAVRCASYSADETAMDLDLKGIAALADQGLTVALSGVSGTLNIREDVLWLGIDMMKAIHDEKKVLEMMTLNPARLLGVDDITGSIEVGKRADLVLWSADPLKTYQAEVLRTFMGGRTIYQKGDELRCM